MWKATDPTLPLELWCEACGNLVDLSSVITVKMVDPDGSEVQQEMTEAAARRLLDELGIQQPPIICAEHEKVPGWVSGEYSIAN